METETVYYICKICQKEVTKGYLSNQGMLNHTCKECIPKRNNIILDRYLDLRKTMHQFPALEVIQKEQGLVPETLMKIIIDTKRIRNQSGKL